MASRSSAIRSSRSSRRYSPYARSPSVLSNRRRAPPGASTPPASINYSSPHPLSAHQDDSFTQQPALLPQTIASSQPTTSNPYMDPATFQSTHPLPTSLPLHVSWTSAATRQPENLAQGQVLAFRRPSPSVSDSPRLPERSVGALEARAPHVDAQVLPPTSHHQSILSQGQPSAVQEPRHSYYPAQGPFSHAQNFVVKDSVFIDNSAPVDNFMEKLLEHTIIGAEFDSSDRDPPPRCHPGTRLAILQRCLDFIVGCTGEEKLRWVVGPAGVGKSAVMQTVVENAPDGISCASVFLSVNGRQDGAKTIVTIAYQLAVKCEAYGQFIRNEINRDPSLARKSLSVHFERFIVKPFIHHHLFDPARRFLVVIDGLDECNSAVTQQNLLELVSNFCISYPTSPIAWIIASRPEPHITSFFDKVEIQSAYIKEEMEIDSDQACNDVQRYLRDELNRIKLAYSSLKHKRQWPSEHEFTKIASAAGGLFAYASTVVRYIDDPRYRDPSAQLCHVLETIDGVSLANVSGRGHPMAQLDALYARILSNIPDDVMITTRKILLLYADHFLLSDFRSQCNLLGLTEDTAYGAVSHLHAVVRVPEPHKADDESLEYFHKSFQDFLFDSQRSGSSHNVHDEAKQLEARILLEFVEQVPHDSDGFISGDGMNTDEFGVLQGGPGACDWISLSWPGDERFQKTDADLRRDLYCRSMSKFCTRFVADSTDYSNISCFQVLTTRFATFGPTFPFLQLRGSALDNLYHELTELGTLKAEPLRTLDYSAICATIELRFTSPIGMNVDLSDFRNASCEHFKRELKETQEYRGWMAMFERPCTSYPETRDNSDPGDGADAEIPRYDILAVKPCHKGLLRALSYGKCDYCSRLLARHFISNPDRLATVFVDSTEMSYVEISFVDPNDGVSEWRYRFCHSGPPKRSS